MENHSDDAFREVRAILDHRKVDENVFRKSVKKNQ